MSSPVKKILIQTVGTGGEGHPVWQALAFSFRVCRPDLLVQWCSSLTKEETVPRFLALLKSGELPESTHRTVVCQDKDNVELLTQEYLNYIDQLKLEFSDAIIEVDFTSGTKAMSAAAVTAAVARSLWKLHYGVGERDDSGRATETKQLFSAPLVKILADGKLQELGRLFNMGQFTAVRLELNSFRNQITEEPWQSRAESLFFMATVYELWQLFSWKKSFSEIKKGGPKKEKLNNKSAGDSSIDQHEIKKGGPRKEELCTSLERTGWNLDVLERQKSFLYRCKDDMLGSERLVDLYCNAGRCIDSGRNDDGVARLYRLAEYIAQVRFHKFFAEKDEYYKQNKVQEPTTKVSVELLKEYAPRWTEEKEANSVDGKLSLGLNDTWILLAETGDPLACKVAEQLKNQKSKLNSLLERRNKSLLAHGTEAIKREDAEDLCERLAEILDNHLKSRELDLKGLQETATFLRCPWVSEE